MGNHRAERRGPSRRPSDLPTPVAERTSAESPTVARSPCPPRSPASAAPRSRQARRHAARRVAAREGRRAPSSAPHASAASASPPAPARRASRHSASRGPLFRCCPRPGPARRRRTRDLRRRRRHRRERRLGDEPTRFSQASALSGASDVVPRQPARPPDGQPRLPPRRARRRRRRRAGRRGRGPGPAAQRRARQARRSRPSSRPTSSRLNQWVLPVAGYHLTARVRRVRPVVAATTPASTSPPTSGTPIHAVANGVVTSVGYDGAYGNKTVDDARRRHRDLVLPPDLVHASASATRSTPAR